MRAERLQAQDEQWIQVVVVRVALRRGPDDRAGGSALVMVVENLRQPVVIEDAVDVFGLGLRRREEVAVVVVADVFLVQARQAGGAAPQRIGIPHIPVGDEVVAVRVRVDEQDDAVVEEPQGLRVVPADHLIDHLGELLRAERLARVQAAVNPHDCFPLGRECPCLVIAEALRQCQPAGDVAILLQVPVIGWRGDNRHQLRLPFGGPPDLLEHHAVRLGVERAPVVGNLLVVGELIVVAEIESELCFRRGDLALRGGRGERGQSDERRPSRANG